MSGSLAGTRHKTASRTPNDRFAYLKAREVELATLPYPADMVTEYSNLGLVYAALRNKLVNDLNRVTQPCRTLHEAWFRRFPYTNRQPCVGAS